MKRPAFFLALSLIASTAFAFPKWVEVGIGSHDVGWTGGSGTLSVAGTFGGSTVTFFYCAPLTGLTLCSEIDAVACTFTGPGFCDFFKGPGDLQLIVAGGTPSITAVAAGPTQASAGGFGGGGVSFDAITTGTNLSASMVIGTGSSLSTTGAGTLTANVWEGSTDLTVGSVDPTARLNLPTSNDAVTPTLNFGDFGTGFYRSNTNRIGIAIASALFWEFSSSSLSALAVSGPIIHHRQPSNAITSIAPDRNDPDTGLGRDVTSGGLSLIDNGVEGLRVLSTEVLIMPGLTFRPPPDTSPPTTCDGDSDGHLYDDTDQDLLCRCDGTTWAGVGGGATCT